MTFIITIPVSTAFAASCNHNYPTGNCGRWFNTKSEGEYQVAVVADYWAHKYESGEITWVEYNEGVPYGYEMWACAFCKKWSVNFKYEEKTCNHRWSKETVVTEPTCHNDGHSKRNCTRCGIEDSRILPAGHHIKQTVTPATASSQGHTHSECTECGFLFGDYDTPKTVSASQLPFTDIAEYEDYSGYVAYTSLYNRFITGSNPPVRDMFSPKDSITRAMFVTILYRMVGEPYKNANPYKTSPFTDIKDKSVYYYDAACCALDKKITMEKTFKPYDAVTRQQTATFLFTYAKENNMIKNDDYLKVDLSQYPDYEGYEHRWLNDRFVTCYYPGVANWAKEPLQWANYNGMITGTQQGYINPLCATQRIHATKILYGFGKTCNIGNFE